MPLAATSKVILPLPGLVWPCAEGRCRNPFNDATLNENREISRVGVKPDKLGFALTEAGQEPRQNHRLVAVCRAITMLRQGVQEHFYLTVWSDAPYDCSNRHDATQNSLEIG